MGNLKDICLVLVALASVTVIPYFSRKSTKEQIAASAASADKQIRASVVSANRQQWINTLRDLVSDFLTCLTQIRIHTIDKNVTADVKKEVLSNMKTAILSRNKIRLLLNPKEDDHNVLVALLESQLNLMRPVGGKLDIDKCVAGEEDTITATQTILKAEWEIVKRGK